MKTALRLLVLFLLAMVTRQMHGQNDLSIYQMGSVPQRLYVNPAFIPQQGGYIGLPVISGFATGTSIPFTYSDIFKRDADDSIVFQVDNFFNKISKSNLIRMNSVATLLSFGTMTANGNFYLEFGIRSRVSQEIMLPAQLFQLAWYGNHAPGLFGERLSISPRINAMAYDEFGFTFSGYALKKRLSYGVKVKYLSGRFNIKTVKSDLEFYTNPETYDIEMRSDLEVLTSGIDSIDNYFDQPWHAIAFPGNPGFSLDFGAAFQINRQFSVSASVLDIGSISWKKNNLKQVSQEPGKEFKFDGLSLHDFVEIFADPEQFARSIEDSLRNLIEIDSIYDVPYTSALPVRFFVGGSYQYNEKHRFNMLFSGTSWDHNFTPAFSASYNYTFRRHVEFLLSYNIFNNQYTNFGGGFSIHLGPFQLYAVSDNLPGLIFYKESNNYSFQAGLNILLGRNRGTEQGTQEEKKPDLE